MAKDFFRYVLPHSDTIDKELVFFPYWRFKGMLFFCGPAGIKNRFIDVSHQAIASPHFPISVGLRSQAMRLRFLTPEIEGQFLRPTQPIQKMIQTFEQRFARSLPKPIALQSHIGETLSLIYSPFYVADKIYDAILDNPVSSSLPDGYNIDDLAGAAPEWRIHFVSTLCPNCGWDLEGERDALVLMCKNCNSAWYPVGNRLKQLKFARIPANEKNGINLPFWRIKANISGINLQTYADLIRIANLPKVIRDDWDDIPFHFWIPAFKVRPQVFLRLASHITVSQPRGNLAEELPQIRHHPSNLPVDEAIECLQITLASFMKSRKTLIEKVTDVRINAKSVVLVYVPFQDKHHEFVQTEFQLALNKNVLALSKSL